MEHVDPDRVESKEDLARELTTLRLSRGLTVRELAKQVNSPLATIGDYFAGRHLPGTRQLPLFQAIIVACGVSDQSDIDLWVAALGRARLATDGRAAKGPCPYRGLEAFTESDAGLFFGREAAVDELVSRVRATADSPAVSTGAIAVVGSSGSGKSSLLLAGLLPAVRAGALDTDHSRWEAIYVTADRLSPAESERDLLDVIALSPSTRHLVVVDQLETVLALPAAERAAALEGLGRLQESALAVYGLRADFYQTALSEPLLVEALRNQLILGPMTAEELHDAVVGPLRQVGAGIEDGFVDLILSDLAPGSPPGYAHEAGALPLLSYALFATWDRSTRNQLTINDYRAVGGLRGAVRHAAEEAYGDLSEADRDEARRIFSRLVRIDDDGLPMRRRARRNELTISGSSPEGNPGAVLEQFVSARLVTADAETVQISHEALLNAWPRLAGWVESDRDWLRLRHQISDASRTWSSADGDESLLWRGARLHAASELVEDTDRARDLNLEESEFIRRSLERQHEEDLLRRRRARRTKQLLGAVSLLTVAAVVLATVAVSAEVSATRARDQALSRQVALESEQLASTDPALAAQLALAAYRISPTVQARSTLIDTTAGETPFRLLGPAGPQSVSVSANGQLLAVAQSGTDTVALYRLARSTAVRVATLRSGPSSKEDYAVAISPDGRQLAAGGTTGTIALWNISNPARPTGLTGIAGIPGTVYSLAFAPDGRTLAAADGNGTVLQWNLTDPAAPRALMNLTMPGRKAAKAVTFSPDGTAVVAAGSDGALAEWNARDYQGIVAAGTGGSDFDTISFSPKQGEFAVGSGNGDNIEAWSIQGDRLRLVAGPILAATSEVDSVAYSPDGSLLAESSADGSIHLYSTKTWAKIASFGDPDPVTDLTFDAGGDSLITADSGGVTRIWPLPPPAAYTQPGNVYSITYSGNGALMASSSAGAAGGVTIWRTTNPLRPTRLVDLSLPSSFGPAAGVAAIDPSGHYVAVGNANAQIQVFDLTNVADPAPIGPLLNGNTPYIEQLGFSPNGEYLLASDDTGQVRIWNIQHPANPRALPTIQSGHDEVLGWGIAPNGSVLATASADKKVRVYDIRDIAHAKLVATLGGFTDYVYDATITPNGKTLIAGSADGTIRIWDISNPRRPRLLGRPITGLTGYVFQVTVSPDGHTLAAATTAHSVWLWNIVHPAHPALLVTLSAANHEVFIVRFDPNDRVLSASGSDNMLHFWDYQTNIAGMQVCRASGDPITRTEWSRYIQGAGYKPPC